MLKLKSHAQLKYEKEGVFKTTKYRTDVENEDRYKQKGARIPCENGAKNRKSRRSRDNFDPSSQSGTEQNEAPHILGPFG
jgi:hypothetical protein